MIEIGQPLGSYTIVARLGQGGMGEVYLAQHRRLARRAAIKVLVPELSQNAAVVERFFTEARATSLLRHPGIVEVFDCDLHEGRAFIVMEFLEGESIAAYLRRTGPLASDLATVLGMGVQVAAAVGAAHARSIVHRDLKPDNVYLHIGGDGAPVVKVLDFGIAKLSIPGAASHTGTGALLGTPSYMSPEQCRGAGKVDQRSDIYSLGCILYEAVCGAPPFEREGFGELIVAHLSEAPLPPSQRVPGVAAPLDEVVLSMLAKQPEDRPSGMDDVERRLRACGEKLGVSVGGPLHPRTRVNPPIGLPTITAAFTPSGVTPPPGTGKAATPATDRKPVSDPDVGVGGTQLLPSHPGVTPLGDLSRARVSRQPDRARRDRFDVANGPGRRWGRVVGLLAVGVLAAVALFVFTAKRGRPPVEASDPAPAAQTQERNVAPPASAPPPRPIAEPDFVTVEIVGAPEGTTVTVDGQPSAWPPRLPRGPESHTLVIRTSAGQERTFRIDALRDRLLEFGVNTPSEPARGGNRAVSPGRRRDRKGNESRRPEKRQRSARTPDREAITDI